MIKNPTYTMKFASLQTGLKPYLIRSWETRHQAIRPRRSANQRRCFTDQDIRRLRLLKHAVDQGHAISAVAPLSDSEIEALLRRPGETAGDRAAPGMEPEKVAGVQQPPSERVVENALSFIMQLDAAALEHELDQAAVDLPRQAFVHEVVWPLFERIGERWRRGQMKIINEHMASVVVRAIMWEMLRSVSPSKAAPLVVVATPVGHWHELGALASALAAAESGWRVAYFGPNLPSEEMAYAVKRLKARALALSLCHLLHDNRLIPELKKLRRLVGDRVPIFLGGPGVRLIQGIKEDIKASIGDDMIAFRKQLEGIAADKENIFHADRHSKDRQRPTSK